MSSTFDGAVALEVAGRESDRRGADVGGACIGERPAVTERWATGSAEALTLVPVASEPISPEPVVCEPISPEPVVWEPNSRAPAGAPPAPIQIMAASRAIE